MFLLVLKCHIFSYRSNALVYEPKSIINLLLFLPNKTQSDSTHTLLRHDKKKPIHNSLIRPSMSSALAQINPFSLTHIFALLLMGHHPTHSKHKFYSAYVIRQETVYIILESIFPGFHFSFWFSFFASAFLLVSANKLLDNKLTLNSG